MAHPSTSRRRYARSAVTLLALAITLFSTTTTALFQDEAGLNDWHHRWIGTPSQTIIPRTNRGATNAFVATDKSTVASLRIKTGELIWRQVLPENDPVLLIRNVAGNLLTLSGSTEFHTRMLDGKSGQVLWDYSPQNEGASSDQGFGQAAIQTIEDSNLVILNQGSSIRKLNTNVGQLLWEWKAEAGSPTTFLSLLEAKGFDGYDTVIYSTGLTRGISSFSIEVVALDPISGDPLKTFTVPSKIARPDDILVLGGGSAKQAGYVAWLEQESLSVLTLGTGRVQVLDYMSIVQSAEGFETLVSNLEFVDLGLPEGYTQFLLSGTVGEYNDATSAVLLEIDQVTGSPHITYDFGERVGFSSFAATIKPSSTDLVITRSTRVDTETANIEFMDVSSLKSYMDKKLNLHMDQFAHFAHSAVELYSKGQGVMARVLFSTSDGSFHSYSDVDSERWYREESLAYANNVEFLDLPERKLWTKESDELKTTESVKAEDQSIVSRFVQRLTTHVLQLKGMPAFVLSYANPSSLFSKKTIVEPHSEVMVGSSNITEPLYRDQFGIRKLILFATSKGKVVALDSANKGQLVWSKYYPWGHTIRKMYIVRQANVRLPPLLVIVGETSGGEQDVTRLYRVNALTGEDYEADSYMFPAASWIPSKYLTSFKVPLEDPTERTQVLALVDDRMSITPYPSTPQVLQAFKDISDDVYFMLGNEIGSRSLQGFKPIISADSERLDVQQTWSMPFPNGERIVALGERPSYEVMASLGKVLGDRGVLYKYQNPNYATVITRGQVKGTQDVYLSVYLVDIVKGSILHKAIHENVGADHKVLATQFENVVVYTFWSEGDSPTAAKGFQAVSMELYEGSLRNQRVKSDAFSSFTNDKPYVISQSFPFPHEATSIGVTTTRAGISAKDVLFGLARHSVMAVNSRFLDPRRPKGAPTAMDREEMLMPYAAISDDARFLLSYNLEVANVKHLQTAPTLLESTTVVVGFGQDVYCTRHAPSKTFDLLNEDFSKAQLLLTIVMLVGVMVFTGPMMKKKQLKELWY